MLTTLKRQLGRPICCPSTRPRVRCIVPKATSFLPNNQALKTSSRVDDGLRQRTGSYVNFSASAVDFYRVLARLEAASALNLQPPYGLVGAASAGAPAPQRNSWAGILDGMFGGARNNKQQQAESTHESSNPNDDDNPLSHAVVMFTATWCGPCSVVYRELKLAAGRLDGRGPTAILVVDVEEEKDLASELGVKALPTLLYMSPAKSRGPIFTQGPVSASVILDALDRAVAFGGHDVKTKWLKL